MMIGKFLDGKGRETQAISKPQLRFFCQFFIPALISEAICPDGMQK